eukprot:scaffold51630_cov64-Phaeocystis_antarctica.AAC.3
MSRFLLSVFFLLPELSSFLGEGSVGKKRGRHNNARTEIETAGSGKDLDFWLWPLGAGRPLQAAPYASSWPHPF